MSLKFKQALMALLLSTLGSAYAAANPHGTITCDIGSTPVSYSATYAFGGANATSLLIPVTCTQSGATANSGDQVDVTVNIGNSNSAPGTTQNTANKASVPSINYDFYTTTACNSEIHDSTNPLVARVTVTTKNGTNTGTAGPFYGCVPVPAPAANGTYTDTVSVTIPAGGVVQVSGGAIAAVGTAPAGVINVSITIPERCTITLAGDLPLNYTAFGPIVNGSKSFSAVCGSTLRPVMTLTDNAGTLLTTGVAAGVNYTLGLNTSASGGTGTLAATAGGGTNTYYINAVIASGQAGSCASPATNNGATCTESKTHYVTITW